MLFPNYVIRQRLYCENYYFDIRLKSKRSNFVLWQTLARPRVIACTEIPRQWYLNVVEYSLRVKRICFATGHEKRSIVICRVVFPVRDKSAYAVATTTTSYLTYSNNCTLRCGMWRNRANTGSRRERIRQYCLSHGPAECLGRGSGRFRSVVGEQPFRHDPTKKITIGRPVRRRVSPSENVSM